MRRRVLLIIASVTLPFFLTVFASYLVIMYTTDGRLALWIVLHSQTMTDSQIAQAIGRDPFKVLWRAGLMTKVVPAAIVLLIAALVACFEKRSPGKIAALALTPYFLWDFSMTAFSKVRAPLQAALYAGKVLGANFAYVMLAAVVAAALVRVWRQPSVLSREAVRL